MLTYHEQIRLQAKVRHLTLALTLTSSAALVLGAVVAIDAWGAREWRDSAGRWETVTRSCIGTLTDANEQASEAVRMLRACRAQPGGSFWKPETGPPLSVAVPGFGFAMREVQP